MILAWASPFKEYSTVYLQRAKYVPKKHRAVRAKYKDRANW